LDGIDFEWIRHHELKWQPHSFATQTRFNRYPGSVLYDITVNDHSLYKLLWGVHWYHVLHKDGNQFNLRRDNLFFIDPEMVTTFSVWPHVKRLSQCKNELTAYVTKTMKRKTKKVEPSELIADTVNRINSLQFR
jgi:hypothetical protein